MKKNILLSTFTALCLIPIQSVANNQNLEDVTIWETQVVSSSINLGKSSIQMKQADHLSDLLRDIPGVNVGGTHSINNRINIRGLQDENIDIKIDGAKVQNANMFHHIGNLLINPDILRKADIQVGTNSVVNGSLAGSVFFETKDGKEMLEKGKKLGARISSTYNSNNSLSGSLTAYGAQDKFSFLIYHNHLDRKNWKYPNKDKTFGVKGTAKNTLLKATYDVDDTQSISISFDNLKDEGDYLPRPDFNTKANAKFSGEGVTFDTEYERKTLTFSHKVNLGEQLKLKTTLYSNENTLSRYEKWKGRSPRPGLKGLLTGEVKTKGIDLKAQSNLQTGNIVHTFTYGALYDKQTSSVNWENQAYGKDESAKSMAVYVEDAVDFDNGLVLTPGGRYNYYDFDGAYGKIKDKKFTYSLASKYYINDNFALLASVTTLYKGVEMVDILAIDRVKSSEVLDLKSETGLNTEIGFSYLQDNVLGADAVGVSFKYFNTKIKDYINTKWIKGNATKFNDGELKMKGFEASLKYEINDFNSLLTYSHSDSEFKNSKEPLSREPGDMISLNLDYKINSSIKTSWNSMFVLKEKDVIKKFKIKEKKAYDVHNAAINFTPSSHKNLTIIAGVDNIFNKEYVSHTSENREARGVITNDYEPGRNVKITLSYKF